MRARGNNISTWLANLNTVGSHLRTVSGSSVRFWCVIGLMACISRGLRAFTVSSHSLGAFGGYVHLQIMAMHGPKQGTTANSKAWRYAYIKEYKSRGGDMSTYKLWLYVVPNKALQQTVRLGGMHTLKNINLGEGICPLTNYGYAWSQTRHYSKQ